MKRWRVTVRYKKGVQRRVVQSAPYEVEAYFDYEAVRVAMTRYATDRHQADLGRQWVLKGVDVIDREDLE